MKTKRALAAELKLIEKLQVDHGYMFADLRPGMVRDSDRFTMQFRRDRKTGKHTLTAARVMRVMAPDDSHLASVANAAKPKRSSTPRRKTKKS